MSTGTSKQRRPRIHSELDAAIGKRGGLDAIPQLREALYHRKEVIRQAAAWSLGEIAHESALPDLLAATLDPDWLVRRNAIAAIGKIGDPATASASRLLPLLADDEPGLRAEAAATLGILANPIAVPALTQLLVDEMPAELPCFEGLRVCDVAAHALIQIGTPEARAALSQNNQKNHDR